MRRYPWLGGKSNKEESEQSQAPTYSFAATKGRQVNKEVKKSEV